LFLQQSKLARLWELTPGAALRLRPAFEAAFRDGAGRCFERGDLPPTVSSFGGDPGDVLWVASTGTVLEPAVDAAPNRQASPLWLANDDALAQVCSSQLSTGIVELARGRDLAATALALVGAGSLPGARPLAVTVAAAPQRLESWPAPPFATSDQPSPLVALMMEHEHVREPAGTKAAPPR
jgi:hypothetical protein